MNLCDDLISLLATQTFNRNINYEGVSGVLADLVAEAQVVFNNSLKSIFNENSATFNLTKKQLKL